MENKHRDDEFQISSEDRNCMKGYIEVGNPETCLDCKFCREIDEGTEACCELVDAPDDSTLCRVIDVHNCMEKPKWCPIKEVI